MLYAGLREARIPATFMKNQMMSFPDQLCTHKRLEPSQEFQIRIQFFTLKMNTKPCIVPYGGVSTAVFPLIFFGSWYLLQQGRSQNSGRVIAGAQGVHGDRHQLLGLTGSGWCLRNTFSPWVSLSLQEIPSVFLHPF